MMFDYVLFDFELFWSEVFGFVFSWYIVVDVDEVVVVVND